MKYAALYFLTTPLLVLAAAGLSIGTKQGQAAIFNPGPHGLTEVMYAFASMGNNNGSAFAGLGTAATWYQVTGGIVMLLGRFAPEIFILGLAGSLARQAPVPQSAGTLRHQDAAVRRHARRRGPHPRRPDLLPGAGAGPVRRRTALMSVTTESPGTPVPSSSKPGGGQPRRVGGGLLDPKILWKSLPDAFKKLDPRVQIKNPVMFVVEVGSVLTLYTAIKSPSVFNWTIVVWLWLTVVFANLAEAVAEGRGKAQAETLRRAKRETMARRLTNWQPGMEASALHEESVAGTALQLGDYVVVEAGQVIPGDGDVVEGVARWTSRPSPASPPRSSASPAATGPRSPAAPPCCPTGSWSRSPPSPARRSSTG